MLRHKRNAADTFQPQRVRHVKVLETHLHANNNHNNNHNNKNHNRSNCNNKRDPRCRASHGKHLIDRLQYNFRFKHRTTLCLELYHKNIIKELTNGSEENSSAVLCKGDGFLFKKHVSKT